jgi:hypothetical protein
MTDEIKKATENLLPLELENIIQEQEMVADERSIDQIVSDLEKGVLAYNKIKLVALKLTGPEDWVQIGKQPYLLESGAQKIAKAFGVAIFDVKVETQWQEDAKGRYQIVVARGKAFSKKLASYIEDVGICSQRDRFFAMDNGELKPIEDVDFANVIKKAVANLYGRLIKRVVGLMGVSWDDLVKAGIKPAAKVEFKEKKPLSPEAQKIGAMILEMAGGDKEAARLMLKSLSEFEKNGQKYSVSSVADLSEAWAKKLLPKVEKEYNEWRKMGSEDEDDKS